jgi:hypothetical protein
MTKRQNHPGPGKSTSEAALDEVKKQVAERNRQAHLEARKRREPREKELAAKRREYSR